MKKQATILKNSTVLMARIALVVILFQLTALDHQLGMAAETDNHTQHCHGLVSGCANSGGDMPTILTRLSLIPTPPSLLIRGVVDDVDIPIDAELVPSDEPPRT